MCLKQNFHLRKWKIYWVQSYFYHKLLFAIKQPLKYCKLIFYLNVLFLRYLDFYILVKSTQFKIWEVTKNIFCIMRVKLWSFRLVILFWQKIDQSTYCPNLENLDSVKYWPKRALTLKKSTTNFITPIRTRY